MSHSARSLVGYKKAHKGLHAQVLSRYCPGIQNPTHRTPLDPSMSHFASRFTSQNGVTRPTRVRGGRVAFVPPPGHLNYPWYPDWITSRPCVKTRAGPWLASHPSRLHIRRSSTPALISSPFSYREPTPGYPQNSRCARHSSH